MNHVDDVEMGRMKEASQTAPGIRRETGDNVALGTEVPDSLVD